MPGHKSHGGQQRSLLLVIGSLQRGGAERQLVEMANYWARHEDIKVTVATWSGAELPDAYELDGRVLRVYLADGLARRQTGKVRANLARIRRLRRQLRGGAYTSALSFVTESNVLSIVAGLGLGIRMVVSERVQPEANPSVARTWRTLRAWLYRFADVVVAQTVAAAAWLDAQCGVRTVVIPNAMRQLPVTSVVREPLIVAVGRLTPQKGFDLLMLAFAQVAARFGEWRVVIIGEGAERESLLGMRTALGLETRVELLGVVADVETWLARAGIVVQPSRFEGFPNVVMEAMGMGAAVISADCPSGPADLIEDGVNGRLVAVENVTALAEVMTQLMEQPEMRAALGRSATSVRDNYRQDLIMARWESSLFPGYSEVEVRD